MFPMSCKLCNVTFISTELANQHLIGKRHLKAEKLQAFMQFFQNSPENSLLKTSPGNKINSGGCCSESPESNQQLNTPTNTVSSNSEILLKHDKNGPSDSAAVYCALDTKEYYCRFCNITCTGFIPYTQHLQSAKHLKKEKDSSPEALLILDGQYYCDICRVHCSGDVPFQQHTISLKHLKKLPKGISLMKSKYLDSLGEMYTCETCTFSCHTEDSFIQHFHSVSHIENKLMLHANSPKNTNVKPVDSLLQDCKMDKEDGGSTSSKGSDVGVGSTELSPACQVCNKIFPNATAAKLHFDGEQHKKNFKFSNVLQLSPGMLKTSCSTCSKSFDCPEALQLHKKSEDHIKKEKIKLMGENNEKFTPTNVQTSPDLTDFKRGAVGGAVKSQYKMPSGTDFENLPPDICQDIKFIAEDEDFIL